MMANTISTPEFQMKNTNNGAKTNERKYFKVVALGLASPKRLKNFRQISEILLCAG